MELEERERLESGKTKGKPGEEEDDGTKNGAIFPTPSSSSPSTDGDLGHVTKDYLPKPCLLRKKKSKILKQKQSKTNKSTKQTKNPQSLLVKLSLLKYFSLTASLHQEQLMATISLLWKENFC